MRQTAMASWLGLMVLIGDLSEAAEPVRTVALDWESASVYKGLVALGGIYFF